MKILYKEQYNYILFFKKNIKWSYHLKQIIDHYTSKLQYSIDREYIQKLVDFASKKIKIIEKWPYLNEFLKVVDIIKNPDFFYTKIKLSLFEKKEKLLKYKVFF